MSSSKSLGRPDPAFWQGRSCLVTGHTGFKGSWLVYWLRQMGAQVAGLALAPEPYASVFADAQLSGLCHSTIGDMRRAEVVHATLARARPSVVLHLAAQAIVHTGLQEPAATFETNVMGTAHLLDAVRAVSGVQAVVVVTSDKCYRNEERGQPMVEFDPLGGRDPYSASKACQELVAGAYRESFLSASDGQVGLATARAGNVIGGGDFSPYRLIPDLVRGWRERRTTVIRQPHATRPWQHVLEPLSGYLVLAEQLCTAPQRAKGAWNFGPASDRQVSVGEVARTFCSALGEGAGFDVAGEAPTIEARTLVLSSDKAQEQLQWRPRWEVDEALVRTARWYRGWSDGARGEALRSLMRADLDEYGSTS